MATKRKHHNPKTTHTPRGYSHAVAASGGTTIYIAGQVALDAEGNLVGPGDFGAQLAQALSNVSAALKAAGATFADVVKMNTYVVNFSPDMLPAIRDARAGLLPAKKPPASTLVGVQALAFEGLLVEVEAVAVI